MKMKDFKQRVLKEKEQPYIYMQKTQGPKNSVSSPNIDKRFKSKTILNKQNHQPNVHNVQGKTQQSCLQNSFGAAKIMMRQTLGDLKMHLNTEQKKLEPQMSLQFVKDETVQPKFNFLSKSNNFDRCMTERNSNAFAKKHMKTEADYQDENVCPVIQDCQLIKSEYESSQDQENDEKLNYAKCYQRPTLRNNTLRNPLVHQSLNLNYDDLKSRDIVTFGPTQGKNLKKYQFSREQERKMKNQIVNNIIRSSKAEMMRSCEVESFGGIKCIHHPAKKAKYRLNAAVAEGQQESFYCSKCAVILAKKGFDVAQIQQDERKMIMSKRTMTETDLPYQSMEIKGQQSLRQEEFVSFQRRLEDLKDKISSKLNMFNQKGQEMTRIDKKIEMTKLNYDSLIQILKQMRQQEIIKQQKLRKQKSLDINLKKHELSTIMNIIKDTSFEINNERNKLMAMKNKQFTFMLDSYTNKIVRCEQYMMKLEKDELLSQINEFDSNLAEKQIDEESLIHSIFDEMHRRLTDPKLEALVKGSIKYVPTKSMKQTKSEGLESGGSSMFRCYEEDEETFQQDKQIIREQQVKENDRPPFRILFGEKSYQVDQYDNNSYMQDSHLHQSMNVNSSIQKEKYKQVKFFKQQNYMPNTHR